MKPLQHIFQHKYFWEIDSLCHHIQSPENLKLYVRQLNLLIRLFFGNFNPIL